VKKKRQKKRQKKTMRMKNEERKRGMKRDSRMRRREAEERGSLFSFDNRSWKFEQGLHVDKRISNAEKMKSNKSRESASLIRESGKRKKRGYVSNQHRVI